MTRNAAQDWYKDAVFYEVHVKAFMDANGDGVGDFAGLTERLDYFQELGVDCLWILPMYSSPLRDDGYDIADFYGIHPSYGTVEDFQKFLDAAHARDLRVIADLVMPVHARHRYDGTITNLVLAPLVGALLGRRLHQPLSGPRAFSARLLERLSGETRWPESGRSMTDLWLAGTAVADGLSIHEARLGPWRVESNTRTTDLPTMVAQTLGAVFAVMEEYEDLWLATTSGLPVPTDGPPVLPSDEPVQIDVERMVTAFGRGLRDLGTIWEHVLAPETLGDVLSLEADDLERFRFPDDLWARVVYDFALGYHWSVVYRDHLLRSLVPLYLGRTAAFVLATRRRDAAAVESGLDAVAAAFERAKPYLVDRWR